MTPRDSVNDLLAEVLSLREQLDRAQRVIQGLQRDLVGAITHRDLVLQRADALARENDEWAQLLKVALGIPELLPTSEVRH